MIHSFTQSYLNKDLTHDKMLEIRTIGGFGEFGRNCTAIKVDNEVILLDMGLHLENYIRFTENEEKNVTTDELTWVKAIPDISELKDWKSLVIAIIPTHAHLDHVGAIPYLAGEFDAPIISTPFTDAVIRSILRDKKWEIRNELKVAQLNSTHKISEKIKVEFINMTHSTPDAVMVAVHTPYGVIVYANDFKIDHTPTLGEEPNLKRLKELSNDTRALILESLYADTEGHTPSESEARFMLDKLLNEIDSEGKSIIISTFSSHIARLKTIAELGKKMNRKIIFLGRSLARYVEAAEEVELVDFSNHIEMGRFGREIKKRLKTLVNEKEDYIIVCTGHQGERNAVLSRMANHELDFRFDENDIVIFSSSVIPTGVNEENRDILEETLKKKGVDIYTDVHASGHGSKEDLKDIIKIINPDIVIPAHGNLIKEKDLAKIAEELGYKIGEDVFVVNNGETIKIE